MLVCSNCGGENIVSLAWCDSNTGKFIDWSMNAENEGTDSEEEDWSYSWCNDCSENHEQIEQEKYKKSS